MTSNITTDPSLISSPRTTLKRIVFIALPVVATFIMSVGVFISRANIKGWVRVYGVSTAKPGAKSVFRLLARKGKLNKPVKKLSVKVFLEKGENDFLIGKASSLWPYMMALDVPVTYPPLAKGTYNLRFDIDSDMGSESWKVPLTLDASEIKLTELYEEEAGQEGSTIETMSSSSGNADSEGVVISLHPTNARGFKKRSRDILFLKAQTKEGKPLRVKAKLKIISGTLRLPENVDCLPFMAARDKEKCMVEYKEGDELPFELSTDSLGLDSMSLYPMSHGISFGIKYQYLKENSHWSQEKNAEFDVGSIEDDAFIAFLPRILPPDQRIQLKVKGLGKGPLYLATYSTTGWEKSQFIALDNYFGETVINTTGMRGFYKLQYGLSYLSMVNGTANTSLWVYPHFNDPKIMDEALGMVSKVKNLDNYTKAYLSYVREKGLVWKTGYKVKADLHFFAGFLDKYHYSHELLLNTKHKRESSLNRLKKNGQIAVFLLMALSGVALMAVIFIAVFLFIRRRQISIDNMSDMLEKDGVEENFFKDLASQSDEVDSRRQAIAFGFIVAVIIGFIIVASIWLMLHIKWEM
ncbi:hypothetical protein KKF84_14565 [Myxococcota bacterium]|nr:hypothetical protein [Myxococcota bacterium]MBU1536545.1 hypothetical protein [Myxococcota bacterium]